MERLKLNDFINYKFLSNIQIGPDKNNTAFIVHTMDLEANKYDSSIYLYDEVEKSSFRLTSMKEETSFIWKNEKEIVFPALRDSRDRERREDFQVFTAFYQISIDGGEAIKTFEIPMEVSSFQFIDDENIIFTANFDHEKERLDSLSKEDRLEEKDYMIFDELPFWANGEGPVNKIRNRAYTYNISRNEIIEINDDFTNTLGLKLNKDRTRALLISKSYEDLEPLTMDLSIYDIENDRLKTIDSGNYRYHFADFIGDKIVFIGTDMKRYGLNENPHIYTINMDGSDKKQISPVDFDRSIGSSVGSDCRYGASRAVKVDGDFLYFTTTEGGASNLKQMDLDGNMKNLTKSLGSIDGIDVVDGKIRFVGLRGLKLQELYSLEGEEDQLTSFNNWLAEERSLSRPDHLSFHVDGLTIEGWVMKPVDFKEGKKYPTILNIHGGPKTVFGPVFFHEMQYWANQGYGVIFCNPRGSDGRGNDFADIRGKYGSIDFDDLMNFTDLCIERYPFIDGDRLGVAGGSYGGFMTNWIIGHTDRFKAAASQRSISNWFSFFGTTDIGYYFTSDQQAASPWDNPEKLWDHSPMKYADRVTTPTLFIHSEEDYRCWMPEALQMFSALKYHGVDSRLCLFKGENHELSRSGLPKHRVKRLREITNWFDKYLKD